MSHYRYKAKPCIYRGVKYDSRLEMRMAKLLYENGVDFSHHVTFLGLEHQWIKKKFKYNVDFIFGTLSNRITVKLKGMGKPYHCIEVKGALTDRDLWRAKALKNKHGLRTFIATPIMIDWWEREGLFWPAPEGEPSDGITLEE